MEPAKTTLAAAIENTSIVSPICPIYQNVPASGVTDAETIKSNLIAQLTAPVKWTQSVQQLLEDGATEFTEVGPGKVLQGLVKNRSLSRDELRSDRVILKWFTLLLVNLPVFHHECDVFKGSDVLQRIFIRGHNISVKTRG